ncbi:MAG TPA: hypothetical protein VNY05_27750 [Candidatus Acidoferrales bacterium]|jgi:hypothetical protein|nr:hypothetical protein [Candidatus Acidoferrales bacterium]
MLAESDRIVIGYHGTSVESAAVILGGGAFRLSQNDYDWLGHGVYFWEYAPYRAREWAIGKHGPDAAVVEAKIRLGRCLDLTDIRYTEVIRQAFDGLREAYAKRGSTMPVNRGKARRLDCLVINYVAEYVLPECETVRAPFLEGSPIFDGSALLSASHVQIVIRRPTTTITGIRIVDTWGDDKR